MLIINDVYSASTSGNHYPFVILKYIRVFMFLYILPNKAFKYMPPPLPLSPRHAHGIIKARRLNKQIYTDAKTKTAVVFTSHVVQTKEINYWKEQKSRKLWRTENKEIWIYLGMSMRS